MPVYSPIYGYMVTSAQREGFAAGRTRRGAYTHVCVHGIVWGGVAQRGQQAAFIHAGFTHQE